MKNFLWKLTWKTYRCSANGWRVQLILKSKNGDLEIPIIRQWRYQYQAEQDVERLKAEFSNQILKVHLSDVLPIGDRRLPCYGSSYNSCLDGGGEDGILAIVSNLEETYIDGYAVRLTFTHIESFPQVLSCDKGSEVELSDGTIWKTYESHKVKSQLCLGDYVVLLDVKSDIHLLSLGSKECPKYEILPNNVNDGIRVYQ